METDERTLEVTVISANDLKKVRNFGPDVCYAVAYIRSEEKKATRVDKEGRNNPTWNSKLILNCDESLLQLGTGVITVDIYSHGSFSNKLVGTSKIPLLDVGKETHRPTPTQYEVRRPSGKVRGFLTVSVLARENRKLPRSSTKVYPSACVNVESAAPSPPATTSCGVNTGNAGPVYTPPEASTIGTPGHGHGASTLTTGQVYPPLRTVSSNADQVYPPSGDPSGRDGSSLKVEEPVMAYPAAGYGAMQHPPHQCGPRYPGALQAYPPAQANVPYSYQQAYYARPWRPPRRQGGSGIRMEVLGEVIGDMGGR